MKRLALVIALASLFVCAYAASANFDIIFNNITDRQVLVTCDQSDGERSIVAELYDDKNAIVSCVLKSKVYLPLVEK